jgi:O-antigen/teichoic acid export membrane protein
MLAGLLATVQQTLDILLLGVLAEAPAAGVYHAAARLAQLPALILVAANVVVAPGIARCHRLGDRAGLAALLARASRLTMLAAVALALVLAAGRTPLLDLFGGGFAAGGGALLVLLAGQLVNVACGPVALALSVTGHARDALAGVALAAAVNLALSLLLIPPFGLLGAAAATAVALAAWNLLLQARVRRRLGVEAGALGWLAERRR